MKDDREDQAPRKFFDCWFEVVSQLFDRGFEDI
jgi:hypothetical protein